MKFRLPFLIVALLIFLITGPACSLTSRLAARLGEVQKATPTRLRRYVVLPPAPTTATASVSDQPTSVPGLAQLSLPGPAPYRPTATATPGNFLAQLSALLSAPTATPTRAPRLAALPTVPPTVTATPSPTFTPWPTDTPTATPTFPPIPTDTPIPTDAPIPPPAPTLPPPPVQAPPPTAIADDSTFTSPIPGPSGDPGQVATPAVAAASTEAGYDFLLAEFYNSPTSNSFMVMYVAIVDANEIPIGDMKVVGTRLDYNLTYESPLSTWHFEGYNAPGEVIKSGNVKFEPPGGIETTSWMLHLEDANGVRMSEDIPFDTNQNDKQWYFIKFKRKF